MNSQLIKKNLLSHSEEETRNEEGDVNFVKKEDEVVFEEKIYELPFLWP